MWLKESNDIKESDNVKIIENGDTHILSIKEATKKDDGMYTARATNVNGSLLCTAEVTVLESKYSIFFLLGDFFLNIC